jgi:hypothetical protein
MIYIFLYITIRHKPHLSHLSNHDFLQCKHYPLLPPHFTLLTVYQNLYDEDDYRSEMSSIVSVEDDVEEDEVEEDEVEEDEVEEDEVEEDEVEEDEVVEDDAVTATAFIQSYQNQVPNLFTNVNTIFMAFCGDIGILNDLNRRTTDIQLAIERGENIDDFFSLHPENGNIKLWDDETWATMEEIIKDISWLLSKADESGMIEVESELKQLWGSEWATVNPSWLTPY